MNRDSEINKSVFNMLKSKPGEFGNQFLTSVLYTLKFHSGPDKNDYIARFIIDNIDTFESCSQVLHKVNVSNIEYNENVPQVPRCQDGWTRYDFVNFIFKFKPKGDAFIVIVPEITDDNIKLLTSVNANVDPNVDDGIKEALNKLIAAYLKELKDNMGNAMDETSGAVIEKTLQLAISSIFDELKKSPIKDCKLFREVKKFTCSVDITSTGKPENITFAMCDDQEKPIYIIVMDTTNYIGWFEIDTATAKMTPLDGRYSDCDNVIKVLYDKLKPIINVVASVIVAKETGDNNGKENKEE